MDDDVYANTNILYDCWITHVALAELILDIASRSHLAVEIKGIFSDPVTTNWFETVEHSPIAPEAAVDGPIGILENGDHVTVDIPDRELSETELEARKADLRVPDSVHDTGVLAKFGYHFGSVDIGAVTNPDVIPQQSEKQSSLL